MNKNTARLKLKKKMKTPWQVGHAHHADEEEQDQNDGEEHNDDSNDMEQSPEKQDTTSDRIFVKNKRNTTEICKKCTRKILNGVRCRECAEAITLVVCWCSKDKIENTKKELLKENQWTCSTCTKSKNSSKKNSNESCAPCKCKDKEITNLKSAIREMEKNSENSNHELKIINDRCTDLEDRLYRERNLRKSVEKDLHELEKNMQDSSESDSSSSDDEIICSPLDTDRRPSRRQSKDRSRSKQQRKRHKKNSHKGKPCYERQHSSKNSSDKPTEESHHDDQEYESKTVMNPYLEKAQECLEQYGYGDEVEQNAAW